MEYSSQYSVSLVDYVKEFDLENMVPEINLTGKKISSIGVNRPALQLAGFFDYFENNKVQLMGVVERAYLERLEPMFREDVMRKLFSFGFPCLVVCNNMEIFPETRAFAKEFNVPVFRTKQSEMEFLTETNIWLSDKLAERVTIHGVLVDIAGVGVLIIGDSGIGKSEAALELVKRGHRFVADDAVEIKRTSHSKLVGSCPELIRHFIELRGIGVINVKELFGANAIKHSQSIDLVIKLEMWNENKVYDRMGLNDEYYEILGNKLLCNSIPVRPGRNIAAICEVAAVNSRQRKLGYNAAEVLSQRLERLTRDN